MGEERGAMKTYLWCATFFVYGVVMTTTYVIQGKAGLVAWHLSFAALHLFLAGATWVVRNTERV